MSAHLSPSEMSVGPPAVLVVVGAGTMGRGIATAAVLSGYRVRLADIDVQSLEAAVDAVRRRVARVRDVESDALLEQLTTHTSIESAAEEASVVIEAVSEVPQIKASVFRAIDGSAPAGSLLASNTSTMSITKLSEWVSTPERVVGMHFFNPAHRMRLVEVILGQATAETTRGHALDVARALGKEPIVVRDVPGFVTSRLGLVLGNEAMRLVERGVASASDVDKAMRLGYNHPMGPLELADLVGLDARLNNVRSMYEQLQDNLFEPPDILEELVAQGRLGLKSGAGFYDYDAEGQKIVGTEPHDIHG